MINLRSTDHFVNRHIGPNEEQAAEMLAAIGVNSLEDLISETIPANIRRKEKLNLPDAQSEYNYRSKYEERFAIGGGNHCRQEKIKSSRP